MRANIQQDGQDTGHGCGLDPATPIGISASWLLPLVSQVEACWVPLDDVAGTLCIRAAGAQDGAGSHASGAEAKLSTDEAGAVAGPPKRQRTGEDGAASSSSYPCALSTADGLVEHGTIKADCLTGVYPNVCGEGVGRGHCFALRQLLHMSDGS